jgi:hypothetical protein
MWLELCIRNGDQQKVVDVVTDTILTGNKPINFLKKNQPVEKVKTVTLSRGQYVPKLATHASSHSTTKTQHFEKVT